MFPQRLGNAAPSSREIGTEAAAAAAQPELSAAQTTRANVRFMSSWLAQRPAPMHNLQCVCLYGCAQYKHAFYSFLYALAHVCEVVPFVDGCVDRGHPHLGSDGN